MQCASAVAVVAVLADCAMMEHLLFLLEHLIQ
jgi:hypothetical protein